LDYRAFRPIIKERCKYGKDTTTTEMESESNEIVEVIQEAEATVKYIALPGARKPELWRYFGFRSEDGKTIAKGFDKKVYCQVCSSMQYENSYFTSA